jgi:large subunit ribosomal protein L17
MRHGRKVNHLGRKAAHRQALLANLTIALIQHKRITTTVAKAKALKRYAEPLLTKSKDNTTHSRRVVYSYLQNKEAVAELFREVAPAVADRPGGYTRIIKLGVRLGDNAEMAMIELVDFNSTFSKEQKSTSSAKKRTRRAGSVKKVEVPSSPTTTFAEVVNNPTVSETDELSSESTESTETKE